MGRFLDLARQSSFVQIMALKNVSNSIEEHAERAETKQTNLTKKAGDALFDRLLSHGISIAIDRQTQQPLLLFKTTDRGIVEHCAYVYKPYEVVLTPSQRREVLKDLEYYEALKGNAVPNDHSRRIHV